MSNTFETETTVDENYSVTVPANVFEQADVEAGDLLRWRVGTDGELSVEAIKRRSGAFAELEPVELEENTDVSSNLFE